MLFTDVLRAAYSTYMRTKRTSQGDQVAVAPLVRGMRSYQLVSLGLSFCPPRAFVLQRHLETMKYAQPNRRTSIVL